MSTPRVEKVVQNEHIGPDDYSLGEIISIGRSKLGYTQQDLANKAGVSKTTISTWEKGGTMHRSNYYRVCELLRIDPETKEFVDSGEDRPDRSSNGLPSGAESKAPSQPAPIYTMDVSTKEDRLLHAANEIGSVKSQQDGTYFVSVQTDSMAPTIPRGCMVPVELFAGKLIDARQDGVYIFRLEHSYRIKRLLILPGQRVQVISDNSRYPPFEIPVGEETDLEILGRVLI